MAGLSIIIFVFMLFQTPSVPQCGFSILLVDSVVIRNE
jgi:hypothetical protein